MPRSESTKKKALDLIQQLPADASWEDIMYRMYVSQKIDRGIKAADAGNVVAHKDAKRRFLTPR